jgi:hypothetical protein
MAVGISEGKAQEAMFRNCTQLRVELAYQSSPRLKVGVSRLAPELSFQ